MARKLTPERQKLRLDAIRLRQELGWSERQIAGQLNVPRPTINVWLADNPKRTVAKNTAVEVKNDKLVSKTGNVYIEHECRGKSSGIAISTSPYWAIVLDGPNYKREVIVIIRATRLREICKQSGSRNVKGGDSNTSHGYLMSVVRLLRPLPPSLKGG